MLQFIGTKKIERHKFKIVNSPKLNVDNENNINDNDNDNHLNTNKKFDNKKNKKMLELKKLQIVYILVWCTYRLCVLTMSCWSACVLRRHLMVWAIFAPKVRKL